MRCPQTQHPPRFLPRTLCIQPLASQQHRGAVIGLGDRALESKVRVPWAWRTRTLTPRVIALQNRMRLTQSPRRAYCKQAPYNADSLLN
jgi:hypothetical protein